MTHRVPWSDDDLRDLKSLLAEDKSYAEIAAIFTQAAGRPITKASIKSAARRLREREREATEGLDETIVVEMTTPISDREAVQSLAARPDWEDTRDGCDLWSIRVYDVDQAWKWMALQPIKFTFATAFREVTDWSKNPSGDTISSVEFDPR
ncbi:hypothetical protein ACLBV5_09570 [Brevundimonas sp. M1A4_2e]